MRFSPAGPAPTNSHAIVSGSAGLTSTIRARRYTCTATDSASNPGPRLLIEPGRRCWSGAAGCLCALCRHSHSSTALPLGVRASCHRACQAEGRRRRSASSLAPDRRCAKKNPPTLWDRRALLCLFSCQPVTAQKPPVPVIRRIRMAIQIGPANHSAQHDLNYKGQACQESRHARGLYQDKARAPAHVAVPG